MPATRKPAHGNGALVPRWKPGQSGNPGGRARDEGGRAARIILDEPIPAHLLRRLNSKKGGMNIAPGTKWREFILTKMAMLAANGNTEAAKLIFNRAYGAPQKSLNLSVEDASKTSDAEIRQQLIDFLLKKAATKEPAAALPGQPAVLDVAPILPQHHPEAVHHQAEVQTVASPESAGTAAK